MPPAHLKGALVDKYAEIALFDVRRICKLRRPQAALQSAFPLFRHVDHVFCRLSAPL